MTRYEIIMAPDGWRVHCNGVEGPPYAASTEAIRDTLFIAGTLEKTGEKVSVRIPELDGSTKVWRNLEARDAHLYR